MPRSTRADRRHERRPERPLIPAALILGPGGGVRTTRVASGSARSQPLLADPRDLLAAHRRAATGRRQMFVADSERVCAAGGNGSTVRGGRRCSAPLGDMSSIVRTTGILPLERRDTCRGGRSLRPRGGRPPALQRRQRTPPRRWRGSVVGPRERQAGRGAARVRCAANGGSCSRTSRHQTASGQARPRATLTLTSCATPNPPAISASAVGSRQGTCTHSRT